jgi:hypothetical protein
MNFNIERKSSFEITGITKVVHTCVAVKDGKMVKVGRTFVWEKTQTKKGLRWLKYDMEMLKEISDHITDDSQAEFKEKTILDGESLVHMHEQILGAMEDDSIRVWFSGDTCNIEAQPEVQKSISREEYRKEVRQIGKELGEVLEILGRVMKKGVY